MKNALKHVLGFRRCLSLERMTLGRKDATGKDVNVIVKQVQQLMVLAKLRITGATVYIDMTHGVIFPLQYFLPYFYIHLMSVYNVRFIFV